MIQTTKQTKTNLDKAIITWESLNILTKLTILATGNVNAYFKDFNPYSKAHYLYFDIDSESFNYSESYNSHSILILAVERDSVLEDIEYKLSELKKRELDCILNRNVI